MKNYHSVVLRNALADAFLDYLNDYITVAGFAMDYGLSNEEAMQVLQLGKAFHEKRAANAKSNK